MVGLSLNKPNWLSRQSGLLQMMLYNFLDVYKTLLSNSCIKVLLNSVIFDSIKRRDA